MRVLKIAGRWLLIILVILNAAILISGRTYIYTALANTYLKGRSGPAIDEYKIFENREVKAGSPQPWKMSSIYNTQKIPVTHLADFDKMGTIAYLIIKNDSLVHEQYWDGFGPDSYTNSFSMAKSFVSLLTGIALKERHIKSLDQPVADYLDEFKEANKQHITIRHLVNMSSGLDFDENYASPLAYPAAAYYGTDLQKLTLDYEVAEEPGIVFRYLSGNTELLAMILQKATGKSLSDYMSEKVWKPVGAGKSAYWSLDRADGIEKAYCCFNSNARDFAKIGKLYLDSGKWNGEAILPADYFLSSITPASLVNTEGKKIDNYGYGWWLLPNYKGHQIYYARGILGQYIICIPKEKMVVVRLGKRREKRKGNDHPLDLFYYIDAALEMHSTKK